MKPIEIISPNFLVLTLITVVIYFLLSHRFQMLWLLIVSYVFYFSWGWEYILVLVTSTFVNYWLGNKIGETQSKRLYFIGITFNALSLATLKLLTGPYGAKFLVSLLNKVQVYNWTAILLPVGFSFYTLQVISYLTDVYRKQIHPEKKILNFALYLAYFPKMLAGPIERAKSFLPQIRSPRIIDALAIEQGIYLILLGLLRKMVIADRLALLLPDNVFSNSEQFTLPARFLWIFVFSFVLYNDFAGYTSIVRGVSNLLGIRLSENFRQPFFAGSFSEFWTRWHISFSEWLRDYIFFPSRRWLLFKKWNKNLTILLPPLITMLVSGYWHGAYFAMLGWGLLHGLFLVMEQILLQQKLLPNNNNKVSSKLYKLAIYIAITLAWIPFASSSLNTSLSYLNTKPPISNPSLPPFALIEILLIIVFSLWLDWEQEKHGKQAFLQKWSLNNQSWGVAILLVVLLIFGNKGIDLSGFVYQGF